MANIKWRKSLRPMINKAREELTLVNPQELVRRGGLTFQAGRLELPLLGKVYSIRWPELVLTAPDGEARPEDGGWAFANCLMEDSTRGHSKDIRAISSFEIWAVTLKPSVERRKG